MTTSERRVVITGIGAITPIGVGRDALWEGVRSGKSAVRRITRFDPAPFRSILDVREVLGCVTVGLRELDVDPELLSGRLVSLVQSRHRRTWGRIYHLDQRTTDIYADEELPLALEAAERLG